MNKVIVCHSNAISKEEALKIAQEYEMVYEVESMIELGYTPEEALYEWDIYPDEDYINGEKIC